MRISSWLISQVDIANVVHLTNLTLYCQVSYLCIWKDIKILGSTTSRQRKGIDELVVELEHGVGACWGCII